jgi:hypothetical protein
MYNLIDYHSFQLEPEGYDESIQYLLEKFSGSLVDVKQMIKSRYSKKY